MIIGAPYLASGAAGAKPALAQAVRPDAGVVPRSGGAAPITAESATIGSTTIGSSTAEDALMTAALESGAPQGDRAAHLMERFATVLSGGEPTVPQDFWKPAARADVGRTISRSSVDDSRRTASRRDTARKPGPISPTSSARRPSRVCGESPLT
ncbi:hypothetical protein [Nocardia sp. NPDC050793]|uniref:hypothetical protein n=1 Tax=Nocardia sp. NPDC050793 TaxID=3155159 RepID=UPI0033C1244B